MDGIDGAKGNFIILLSIDLLPYQSNMFYQLASIKYLQVQSIVEDQNTPPQICHFGIRIILS